MKGLYIHIPFCEHICHYCDFVKQVPKNDEMIDKYLVHLDNEIQDYKNHFDTIDTIYIGGGTPSMLKPYQMEKLFESIKDIKAKEITIEVNPESYSMEKGLIFKKYGVNRVSIGVQSFNDQILEFINRKHNSEMVYYTVQNLKLIGINNISIDLIYAIPGQTKEMLYEDLENVNKLNISHVSCYSLILEDKTYFYHQFLKGEFNQVDNEIEGDMFDIVIEELKKQGFEHYEISNFAKNGQYSMHNKLYWNLDEYIGVGLGAHGFIDNFRTYNHKSIKKYQDNYQALKVEQTLEDNITDYMIFGLRLTKGVDISYINHRFNIDLFSKYPELNNKINEGLVKVNNGFLMLTELGINLGNKVFEVFI